MSDGTGPVQFHEWPKKRGKSDQLVPGVTCQLDRGSPFAVRAETAGRPVIANAPRYVVKETELPLRCTDGLEPWDRLLANANLQPVNHRSIGRSEALPGEI